MVINTRVFGEITIGEDKLIHFDNGIIGFPELKDFALIHDIDQGDNAGIRWLQSIQEPQFAMPVMDPLTVVSAYNPEVEDELLKALGKWEAENILVLVTVSIASEIKNMTVNLMAPLIINALTRKACQVIVEGGDYAVKYPIYDILQAMQKAGD